MAHTESGGGSTSPDPRIPSGIPTEIDGSLSAYRFDFTPLVTEDLPLVDIVFVQDWDEDSDAPEFGEVQEMFDYLSQWDYGEDNPVRSDWPGGPHDEVWAGNVNGTVYLMSLNRQLRYAGLYRRLA